MPNPLITAIKAGDIDFVAEQLSQLEPAVRLAAINHIYPHEEALEQEEIQAIPLHLAVYLGYPDMVQLLLKHGADVEITDHFQSSPMDILFERTLCRNVDQLNAKIGILYELIYHRATLEKEDIDRYAAGIMEYHFQGRHELFHLHLRFLQEIYHHCCMNHFNYLLEANKVEEAKAFFDKAHVVQHPYKPDVSLCQFRLNPNYAGGTNGTPLLTAAGMETDEMLQFLIARGGRPGQVIDHHHRNVFHAATREDRAHNIHVLAANMPNPRSLVNQGDIDGNTPLHFSARYDQFETTLALLDQGACLFANAEAKSPTDLTNDPRLLYLLDEAYQAGFATLTWICARQAATLDNPPFLYYEVDKAIAVAKGQWLDPNTYDAEREAYFVEQNAELYTTSPSRRVDKRAREAIPTETLHDVPTKRPLLFRQSPATQTTIDEDPLPPLSPVKNLPKQSNQDQTRKEDNGDPLEEDENHRPKKRQSVQRRK